MTTVANTERRKVTVNGIVQGVGFRPFVFNLAHEHGLKGFVTNTSGGVEIEVEGSPGEIDAFLDVLETKAPPLSVITEVQSRSIPTNGDLDFSIRPSQGKEHVSTLISPDVAVCHDCLSELFDPGDRRYLYPFINCTNCGPRYTIIENIPYDRPFTSMSSFLMCPECQAEYDDPEDRRFHAQPNACRECGPHVSLIDSEGTRVETSDPVNETASLLEGGSIIAIKGLGGFHLAVNATDEEAVVELRRRKGREEKPLAIMVRDVETARKVCRLTDEEERTMVSFQHPIVLAYKGENHGLAPSVAPGNDRFGIMLPYTPLHHILMRHRFRGLVMTSANYSEEPICIANDEAISRLGDVADYFLVHNRDIYLRSDDSVVIHLAGRMRQIRRSRGYVPRPVFVDSDGPSILAVGGELKNSVCLLKDDKAFLSQHIGDLENMEAYAFFQKTIDHLQRILETEPELIVYDLHPRYLSTRWAMDQKRTEVYGVQHHHAHLAACMAENRIKERAIGVIVDGTGYGTDDTIWGGEVLIGDYAGFTRYAHLEPMPLPGGDAAIRAPWRTAVSYLHETFGGQMPDLPFLNKHDVGPVVEIVQKRVSCPMTTSCGRLFDAVAAMSGGRQRIRYEAQAAIEFMQMAAGGEPKPLDYEVSGKSGNYIMLIQPLIRSVVKAVRSGESISLISARFHRTLIRLFAQVALNASQEMGIDKVVLSGGVYQNHILFEGLVSELEKNSLNVYVHSKVPTNDGGICLGQAMVGRAQLAS